MWERNRKLLSEAELNDFRTKDECTRCLWNWIDLVLEGSDISRDPDWTTLEAGAAAVNAHVAEFGICNPEILLLGQFWKSQRFYETLKARKDGTGIFAVTGFSTTLPERRVMQFRELLAATTQATQIATGISSPTPPSVLDRSSRVSNVAL